MRIEWIPLMIILDKENAMSRIVFVLFFVLSVHAVYAMEGAYAKRKKHDGPKSTEQPMPAVVSPNGPPPPGGYINE